ncbi:hypothetical protein ACFQGT_13670 [Natrialbaceae archaeon GCM10025810]|uniref:hypothetical protein n=1 Tax=Halovalidus salilacus TaxID=3075124 RepID=UPI003605C0B5
MTDASDDPKELDEGDRERKDEETQYGGTQNDELVGAGGEGDGDEDDESDSTDADSA